MTPLFIIDSHILSSHGCIIVASFVSTSEGVGVLVGIGVGETIGIGVLVTVGIGVFLTHKLDCLQHNHWL
jgi:hypothetical protein